MVNIFVQAALFAACEFFRLYILCNILCKETWGFKHDSLKTSIYGPAKWYLKEEEDSSFSQPFVLLFSQHCV